MSNSNVNYGLVALVAIIAAVISSLVTYKAVANKTVQFAVVDFQQVVMNSKDVAALRNERETQIQDLRRMADDANVKIKGESDEAKRKKLSEGYLAEINAKKAEYDRLYASSLQASDKKLNGIVQAVAEKEGLKVIFNKGALVQGGTDITDSVVEQVK
ncbi:MAG: OmpH family outer membrane protein [Alphaproteobacteria bacterium]|nr:OmpH family outer membrane protein [Alphaproteobacteria bacterium]